MTMPKLTLLLVEDSEPLRKVLAEKMTDEDYQILEASNGDEGIKLATDMKPDIIVTDIVMYPIDGYTLISSIRNSGPWGSKVPIIALTNLNDTEERARIESLNITAYLVKSDSSLDDIVGTIKGILEKISA